MLLFRSDIEEILRIGSNLLFAKDMYHSLLISFRIYKNPEVKQKERK